MDATGQAQCRNLAEFFNGLPIDSLYCSPLGRAQESARLIFPGHADRLSVLDWLIEFNDAKQCPASETRNIPILGVDRIYDWRNGQRTEVENKMVDFSPLAGKTVLLVAADVLSGGTMKFFIKQIETVKPAALKTGCLVKGITSTLHPDYIGREIPADFVMPWMYKGYGYVRDSRKPMKKEQGKVG